MRTINRNATFVVVLCAALLASAANAQVVVGIGVSGPVYSTNPSVELPASDPQAVLKVDGQPMWGWDSTAMEHLGVLPNGAGSQLYRFPNIRATRGEVSAVGTLDHEPKAAVDFYWNEHEKQMMMAGGRMLKRDERQRYHDIIDLDSLPPGVYKDTDVARVEGASRKDATYFVIFHRAGQRPGTSMPSSTSYMVARWTGNPNPSPGEVAAWMVQMGCGGKPLVPLAPVRSAVVEQAMDAPEQPAAEAPSNGANGQADVSRDGSGIAVDQNENNKWLAAGVAVASAQALAVNGDLQAFKAYLVQNNVTPENVAAIVAYVNGHNMRLDTLEGRVTALETWVRTVADNGNQNDQGTAQVAPTNKVDYRVVFVASANKTTTWEVGDVGEIAEPIIGTRVYVKYQDAAGRWVSGQYLNPGKELWWRGATTGSARTVGVALKPTTSDGSWIHREWFAPAQPGRIVVVPIPVQQ